ncbi:MULTISPECIES: hypothetical protein [Thalassotalea]|uniref:hypothetical protein n=1 Tax=Thalassotalea TaxID=1518149 RepID=UPI000944914F|nr:MULTISPECIES: hypothetical protein [Thalassotalea]OKY24882.1 hypothetical protein BI291_04790 [Thalassotalea sp. PP2-459]
MKNKRNVIKETDKAQQPARIVDQLTPQLKSKLFTSESLSIFLAVCAIFISAASFYATYIQAEAANKQVKAMTMPLIQIDSGNYDINAEKAKISMNIKNAGVGPAIIKYVTYGYKNKRYMNLSSLLQDCCLPKNVEPLSLHQSGLITSPLHNAIIAGNDTLHHITLDQTPDNYPFWQALDKARSELKISICYCSMLDECFISSQPDRYQPVQQCSAIDQ